MIETPKTDEAVEEVNALDYSDRGNVVYADFARRLERENSELKAAIQQALGELGWFVQREKNLSKWNEYSGKTWAEILDEDLNILRDALTKTKGQ